MAAGQRLDLHLRPQHVFAQARRDALGHRRGQDQRDPIAALDQPQHGLHATLRGIARGQHGTRGRERIDVGAQLTLQEGAGVRAAHQQRAQGGDHGEVVIRS